MADIKQIAKIIAILKKVYPEAGCSLTYSSPFELLIATILSAQCTDERVNKVTPALFASYPTPETMGKAPIGKLEKLIRSTGFYHSKAVSLKKTAAALTKEFSGQVPRTMEQLITLRGVARKTANVVLGSAFNLASGVVVDTHVKRLAFRLGLTRETNPDKIERDLMKALQQKDWIWLPHALVQHGRLYCKARAPLCTTCPLSANCEKHKTSKLL